ncbi:hypothetical protein C2S53_010034 [Perilla frutescens var. hirtella]|uniref:Uncharacterized protein n=1 Tax=Perilla frutescens var. hirtella TaxID=608512 RepID=A0AAD4NX30_PERFH|nr:hypothetical protein C2S53_010034 [Perilla frutescens var. hirtella]
MVALSPIPAFDDLKITFQNSSLVFPSQKIHKESMFLSNMDQIPNFNITTAHFFMPNPDFPAENVAKILKIALEKVLVHYDFMAGRLKLNHKIGRLEIDRNAAGVGFVVASSELLLDEIGKYLSHPNLGYRQLAIQKLDSLPDEVDQPLCVFQVTSFKCGGFSMGMSTSHILFDGIGAKTFLENLASQAFNDKPLASIPCNNRRLLDARSPPCIAFPHPEFLGLNLPTGEGSCPPMFDCGQDELDYKIFKLSAAKIAKLKERAKVSNAKTTTISSFAVVAAVVWQCKAFSDNTKSEKDNISTMLNIIDIRPRVNPPLPSSYSGNAVLPLGVSATFEELENGLFSNVVGKILEGAKVATDEYVRSAFDWLEVHRGVPHGDYVVSSWLRLGFEQVRYPWGKPIYICPIVNDRKDTCWVFRDAIDGEIAVMVALPVEEMERFEGRFQSSLHEAMFSC